MSKGKEKGFDLLALFFFELNSFVCLSKEIMIHRILIFGCKPLQISIDENIMSGWDAKNTRIMHMMEAIFHLRYHYNING